jgi:hypothetical protein
MLTGRQFAMLSMMAAQGFGIGVSQASTESLTSLQKEGAVFTDTMSIPSPGEVFAALNRSNRPNWATLVATATAPTTTDRQQMALAVGVLAANGYIALEAQDGQQVKNIGKEINSLAKSLGVSQSLLGRGNSLMEFADHNEWDSLADELEATENEIKNTMVDQKDHDLVILTSVAAWLRGIEVASGVVLADDGLKGASALRQSELASHLAAQIHSLPGHTSEQPLVVAVGKTMDSIASLLDEQNIPAEKERINLQKIHEDTGVLVGMILSSSDPAKAPSASLTTPSATHSGNTP